MCIRPETWAESARYSLASTLLVALLAIVMVSATAATSLALGVHTGFMEFASAYDKSYPPIVVSGAGTIGWKTEFKEPLRYPLGSRADGWLVLIDPSNTVKLGEEKSPLLILVTAEQFTMRIKFLGQESVTPLKKSPLGALFLDPLASYEIKSASLEKFGREYLWAYLVIYSVLIFFGNFLSNSLWVLLVMFVVWPLILIVASSGKNGLPTPKYIAYRMAAAVAVPLVVLGGILETCGYMLTDVVGPDLTPLVWMLAAAGLGIWAGILAKGIFRLPRAQHK